MAHKQNESYQSGTGGTPSVACAADAGDSSTQLAAAKINLQQSKPRHNAKSQNNSGNKCWFCNGERHARDKCPARGSKCNNCSKVGHWAVVCRSSSADTNLGAISALPNLAAIHSDVTVIGKCDDEIFNCLSATDEHRTPCKNWPNPLDDSVDHIATLEQNSDITIVPAICQNNSLITLLDSGSKLSFISKHAADTSIC